jgi:hypothetical protein
VKDVLLAIDGKCPFPGLYHFLNLLLKSVLCVHVCVCVCVCARARAAGARAREMMRGWKEETLTHFDFKDDGALQGLSCCWSNQLHLKDVKSRKSTKIYCVVSKFIVMVCLCIRTA